ncbi:hypothetical protein PFICI_06066 [Pestalotiopsis fici W106-1]|uniref:Uncharacterized protein n=1 Tax=Pestalotiopsis fici (strain W106-1 / CGMCC3.15140) TaxID=1229662 RepID=W3X4X7_PESFW|nr:uncharacterized protein PFICI_06066 [Pestalotiopsis fici W106-1]ETS81064.1 hypothetical protein PFICI_06066 [Pestalotiopsis fici W106-1]
MNRHFFGPSKGLPLDCLSRRPEVYMRSGMPSWTQDWTAKIVDDELFLRVIHVSYRKDDQMPRNTRPWRERQYFCAHNRAPKMRRTYKGPALLPWVEIRRIAGGPNGSEDSYRTVYFSSPGVLHSCTKCLTDFCISVEQITERKPAKNVVTAADASTTTTTASSSGAAQVNHGTGVSKKPEFPMPGTWRITVTAYHQMGSCRTPNDPKWQALVLTERDKYYRDHQAYPPGCVRRKWEQAN